ncbi:MAG: GntR family transcriptional regulator [Oscillospiraceae bacterium]
MVSFSGLEFNKRDAVYEQIAMHVKRQIMLGMANSGDILPSRRELAAITSINPNTAQKAYKLMEDEGYVRTGGNTASTLYVDDAIKARIEDELCRGAVESFVHEARQNNLSYKKVIGLISEIWGED